MLAVIPGPAAAPQAQQRPAARGGTWCWASAGADLVGSWPCGPWAQLGGCCAEACGLKVEAEAKLLCAGVIS